MTNAFDIPNYIQGHIFKNQAAYYDATKKEFIDQAGYGDAANIKTIAGTPKFETANGNEGLLLDNTYHGSTPSPIPWQGSMIVVVKPNLTVAGSTLSRYLLHFGDNPNVGLRPSLSFQSFGDQRRLILKSYYAKTALTYTRTDNDLIVIAFALDQKTRKGYFTIDGVNVTEVVVASPSPTHGNDYALQSGVDGAVFGNLSGTKGDTAAMSDFNAHMYEQHFYASNIITDNLSDTKKLIDELKEKYLTQ